jgi:hypothetical protein
VGERAAELSLMAAVAGTIGFRCASELFNKICHEKALRLSHLAPLRQPPWPYRQEPSCANIQSGSPDGAGRNDTGTNPWRS